MISGRDLIGEDNKRDRVLDQDEGEVLIGGDAPFAAGFRRISARQRCSYQWQRESGRCRLWLRRQRCCRCCSGGGMLLRQLWLPSSRARRQSSGSGSSEILRVTAVDLR